MSGQTAPRALSIAIDGKMREITIRRSPLARTMALRVDAVRGVVLVLPSRATLKDGERFLRGHLDWLAERLRLLPGRLPLVAGTSVPLGGLPHPIIHRPEARRGVWVEDGAIQVSGDPAHVARRVGDFLRAEARRVLIPKVHAMAARLERRPSRVSLKDTVSRWGSCSAQGAIALSWRLVMAPDWVADYVVAHEAAHLAELNHSPAFWALVAGLGVDVRRGRAWLRRHGGELHAYDTAPTGTEGGQG